MNEIRETLMEHNYCMGLQIGAFVQALGMHWENQQRLQNGEAITYTEKEFAELFEENSDTLTHNGILERWHGVE